MTPTTSAQRSSKSILRTSAHRESAGATEVEWIHPIHLAERVEALFLPPA